MKNNSKFWDKIALKYSMKPVPDEEVYKNKLAKTQEYMNSKMDIIEFGCGTGSTAIALSPYVKSIIATDFSESMLEIAKEKTENEQIGNIIYNCVSMEDYSHTKESKDMVLAHSLLHLVEDKDAMIKKAYEVLRPGGYFITSTACIQDIMPIFKYLGPIGQFFGAIPYVNIFTKGEFIKSMKDSGFKIEYELHPEKKKSVFLIAQKI